eukprot:COSAG02_NODE_8216_length_2655_cov_1.480047_3_plen_195_part_01
MTSDLCLNRGPCAVPTTKNCRESFPNTERMGGVNSLFGCWCKFDVRVSSRNPPVKVRDSDSALSGGRRSLAAVRQHLEEHPPVERSTAHAGATGHDGRWNYWRPASDGSHPDGRARAIGKLSRRHHSRHSLHFNVHITTCDGLGGEAFLRTLRSWWSRPSCERFVPPAACSADASASVALAQLAPPSTSSDVYIE